MGEAETCCTYYFLEGRGRRNYAAFVTTVQPAGTYDASRVVVSNPSRQVKVPFDATFCNQLPVALVGFQAVNATSTEDSEVQPWNMPP